MGISSARKKQIERKSREDAAQSRREMGLGIEPVADVFDLLERRGLIVLRYPLPCEGVSAFITKYREQYIVFINSNMTLGRQIFSAAHEYAHYLTPRDNMTLTICNPGFFQDDDPDEYYADCFAASFLMPLDGIRKVFRERFGERASVGVDEIIIMQHTFRVSYAAMARAFFEAGLITYSRCKKLREYGTKENEALLKSLVLRNGYDDALISPTGAHMPKLLVQALNANYEEGRLSYKKLSSLLARWGKKPEEMGFRFEQDFQDHSQIGQ